DARRHPGGDRVERRGAQRRTARRAHARIRELRADSPPRRLRSEPRGSRGGEERSAAAEALSMTSVLRDPDRTNTAFMTKRAWWLVGLNLLVPGAAQVLAGNRRLGR